MKNAWNSLVIEEAFLAGFGGMNATGAGECAAVAGVEDESERARPKFRAPGKIFDSREAGVDQFQGQVLAFGRGSALSLQFGADI